VIAQQFKKVLIGKVVSGNCCFECTSLPKRTLFLILLCSCSAFLYLDLTIFFLHSLIIRTRTYIGGANVSKSVKLKRFFVRMKAMTGNAMAAKSQRMVRIKKNQRMDWIVSSFIGFITTTRPSLRAIMI